MNLPPGQVASFNIYVFPYKAGIQKLSGIKIMHQGKDITKLGKIEILVDSKLELESGIKPRQGSQSLEQMVNLLD